MESMSNDSAGPVRVRLDGQITSYESLEVVEQLVSQGALPGDARIQVHPKAAWLAASDLFALAEDPGTADPWAAWDDADEDSVKEALEGYAEGDDEAPDPTGPPGDLPQGAVDGDAEVLGSDSIQTLFEPLVTRPKSGRAVRKGARSPGSGGAPRTLPPVAASASLDGGASRGKVIAFPQGEPARPTAVQGSAALSPDADPLPLPLHRGQGMGQEIDRLPLLSAPPQEPTASTGTRWWRLALLAGVALSAMWCLRWYVTSTATAVYPTTLSPGGPSAEPPPASAPGVAEPEPAAPTPAAERIPSSTRSGPYADLEREIRSQWLVEPREVNDDGDLEVALLMELPRVHIDLVRAKAPITEWSRGRNPSPEAATFFIRYRPREGELERELAAITLVVGRYMSIYRLKSDQLTIERQFEDGQLRRIAVDPKQALQVYEQQLSLVDFLKGLASN